MTDSSGHDEGREDQPQGGTDPLASTQFFDTTSEFRDEDVAEPAEPAPAEPAAAPVPPPSPPATPEPPAADPTTVQATDPTTLQEIPSAGVPPAAPPPGSPYGAPAGPRPSDGGGGSRLAMVLGGLLVVALLVIGVLSFLLISNDDDNEVEAVAPPTTAPVDEDENQNEDPDANENENEDPNEDPDAEAGEFDEADATEALEAFIAARGTDEERELSSETGREELDDIVDEAGGIDLQGEPQCEAQGDDTFECVHDSDAGEITFVMGIDEDSEGGLEMIGASLDEES